MWNKKTGVPQERLHDAVLEMASIGKFALERAKKKDTFKNRLIS